MPNGGHGPPDFLSGLRLLDIFNFLLEIVRCYRYNTACIVPVAKVIKMGQVTAEQVADYLIGFANEAEEPITNLKLQKLLYYAQGYYLAIEGKELFEDRIEAWVHGPVVPNVYHQYKKFRWQPINKEVGTPTFSEEVVEFLNLIIETFLPIDAYKLEQMTHKENPWIKARGSSPPNARCQNAIKLADMKDYFTALMADE